MKTQSADTSPDAERFQIALMRDASPARRVRLARSLSRTAIALSRRAMRRAHPELSAGQARLEWVAVQYGPALAARLSTMVRGGRMDTTDILDVLTPVVEAFEQVGVPYRIGGSLASAVYGIARSTANVDLVAEIRPDQVTPLVQRLEARYYIAEPAVLDAIHHRSSFNLIHIDTMLKVDVFVPQTRPYDVEAARRARLEALEESAGARLFSVAAPEDIILAKLEWYRSSGEASERQWLDVQGVLKIQGTTLDQTYLQHWALALGVADLLARALADAGLPPAEP